MAVADREGQAPQERRRRPEACQDFPLEEAGNPVARTPFAVGISGFTRPMNGGFLNRLEKWLVTVLQAKAIASARENRLCFIGASDLATLLAEHALSRLTENPNACWTACELDHVPDEQILTTTGFSAELLAAAFIGAVLELGEWQGDRAVSFLTRNGVAVEDARDFVASVEVVVEKFGARGQALIEQLSREPSGKPEATLT